MKRYLKIILAVSFLCTLLMLTSVGTAAAEPILLGDTKPYVFTSLSDYLCFNFSRVPENLEVPENVSVKAVDTVGDIKAYEGSACILVSASKAEAEGMLLSYPTTDLSEYNYAGMAVLPLKSEQYTPYAVLRIYSENERIFEQIAEVCPGEWNQVIFDMSELDRSPAGVMEFGVIYRANEGAEADDELFTSLAYGMDYLFLSASENISNRTKYMSEKYDISGGEINMGEDTMALSFDGVDPYIETYSLASGSLRGASSLLFKIENMTDCREVRLYYTTQNELDFDENRYFSKSIEPACEGDIQNVYFPVPEGIMQLRLVFCGAVYGTANIYSVTPAGYYVGTDTGYGSISECKISPNGREITISGSLSDEAVSLYRGLRILLYEVNGDITEEDILNGRVSSVAQTEVSENFIFNIPLEENGNSRLYSAFAVGMVYNGSVRLIDYYSFVQNPETVATTSWERHEPDTKKGMNVSTSELYTLAPGYVTVDVAIDKLLQKQESHLKAESGGNVYYFNSAEIERIDNRLIDCYNAGVSVSLHFTFKAGAEATRAIDLPGAAKGEACFPYCSTVSSFNMIKAVFGFISERYSRDDAEYGRAYNYIFDGGPIGNTYKMTAAEYAAAYAMSFRTAHTAVMSNCKNARMYVALGGAWDSDIDTLAEKRLDVRTFADMLAAAIRENGDISWNIAYQPQTAENELDYSYQTPCVAMENIEVLCRYINKKDLLYNGQVRDIMVLCSSENLLASKSADKAVSDFVYTYYKCVSLDEIGSVVVPNLKEITEVFRYIDTQNTHIYGDRYLSDNGISAWSELLDGFDYSRAAVRNIDEITLESDTHNRSFAGEIELWGFDSSNDGWQGGIYNSSQTIEASISGKNGVMLTRLAAADIGEYRGIGTVLPHDMDFSEYPYLIFEFQVLSLPQSVHSAEVMVICFSGDDIISAKTVVSGEKWNSVSLSLEDFAGNGSIERIMFLVRGENADIDIGEPVLALSGVFAGSKEHNSEYLYEVYRLEQAKYQEKAEQRAVDMNTVWVLIIVIITASTVLAINILSRIRHSKNDEDDAFGSF